MRGYKQLQAIKQQKIKKGGNQHEIGIEIKTRMREKGRSIKRKKMGKPPALCMKVQP